MSFQELKLNKQLLQAVDDLGYQNPTPIQEKAIPLISAGHDVIGIAQTGTGKTAAYLLPLLMKVKYAQPDGPRALILAPTRELALQINKEIEKLCVYCDIRHTAIYGGTGFKDQIELIEKGLDLLVATPGRLMDIYFKNILLLKNIKTLIIDEADRMMDMGFMPQLRKIFEIIPSKRQNLLFSATMGLNVKKLTEEFIEYPHVIEISPSATTAETVNQYLYKVPNIKTKMYLLLHLLESDRDKFHKVIVFTKTKKVANNTFKFLSRKLQSDEIKVVHGNKDQNARINAINSFKEGEVRILVATDIAARGIDVSMVSHVINLEVPIIHEEYVHRIGRTGRAKQYGEAISMVNPAEEYHIGKIEKLIKEKIPYVTLPDTLEVFPTPYEENQDILKSIDFQKKKENPNYKGAFHDKKRKKKS